ELVVELIAAYRAGSRDRADLLRSLASIDGVYVPENHAIGYGADGTVGEGAARDAAPPMVVKRRLKNVNAFETIAAVKTSQAEYGHMALLEVGKGWGRGWRWGLEGQGFRAGRGGG